MEANLQILRRVFRKRDLIPVPKDAEQFEELACSFCRYQPERVGFGFEGLSGTPRRERCRRDFSKAGFLEAGDGGVRRTRPI